MNTEVLLKNCRMIPNTQFWRHHLLGLSKEPKCARELAFIKTLFPVINTDVLLKNCRMIPNNQF